ncbi:MAG: Ig-like domain-containing protein [Kofleriaceae bacterium]
MRCIVTIVGFLTVSAAASAWAQSAPATYEGSLPPHPAVVPLAQPMIAPPTLVNSHIVYLNNCRPNGCLVTQASSDDARIDHSAIVPHTGTLAALKSTVDFNAIKTCVTTALAPFNITVTDQDPGMQPHFEIMIAGSPQDVGFDTSFEGVAQYLCGGAPGACNGTYIPEALSFAFGNAPTVGGNATLICGVALQETAHGWTLDHTTPSSDPMTYNTYSTPLTFRDNAPCGSDCLYTGNKNAFGVQCSGTGGNATHVSMENNMATQNEVTILKNLFGPAGAVPPTVAVTSPSNGSGQQIGQAFNVAATCTSPDGIKEIDFVIDGQQISTVASSPATFMAPNYLLMGTHHIDVICGTTKLASATASIDVMVGNICATDADCGANKICYQQSCIAGPGGAGGLGATCAMNSDCASGSCGDDGTQQLCVVPCDPTHSQCPDGFGCLADGAGGGVCWLGADNGGGGGCCETGHGDSRGSIVFGLGFAALWVKRRRGAK